MNTKYTPSLPPTSSLFCYWTAKASSEAIERTVVQNLVQTDMSMMATSQELLVVAISKPEALVDLSLTTRLFILPYARRLHVEWRMRSVIPPGSNGDLLTLLALIRQSGCCYPCNVLMCGTSSTRPFQRSP